jgi:hypothetical protein
MSEQYKKITVLLDEEIFTQFDIFCRVHGFKKSTLLARLLKDFMAAHSPKDAMQLRSKNAKRKK